MPELTNHLKAILNIEQTRRAAGELPTHAPAPIMRRKTFKELGTPTEQVRFRSKGRGRGIDIGIGVGVRPRLHRYT